MSYRTLYVLRDIDAGESHCDKCQNVERGNDRCELYGMPLEWVDGPAAGEHNYKRLGLCLDAEERHRSCNDLAAPARPEASTEPIHYCRRCRAPGVVTRNRVERCQRSGCGFEYHLDMPSLPGETPHEYGLRLLDVARSEPAGNTGQARCTCGATDAGSTRGYHLASCPAR